MPPPTSNILVQFAQRLVSGKQRRQLADIHAPLLDEREIAALMQQVAALRAAANSSREVHHRHAGDFRSAYPGHGLDFEEARPYQRGDDLRNMDWRTTARSGKPYLKVYREEHQPALHIVVDRGASMRFGTVKQLKVTQAARIAALFAFSAMHRGACIGGTLLEPDGVTLPCANGAAGALRLVRAAVAPCPPLQGMGAVPETFWGKLEQLDSMLPRGTRLILISDFQQLSERDMPVLLRLASHHELLAVQVVDRAEEQLPDLGMMCFQDSSPAASRWLDTGDRRLRDAFLASRQLRQQADAGLFQRIGLRLYRCRTGDDPFDILKQAALNG